MPSSDPPLVTLDTCAQEPIHIPGSIQPHGVLFACRDEGLVVSQVSANVVEHLGIATDAILGRSLFELCDGQSADALRGAMAAPDRVREINPVRVQSLDGRAFDAVVHRSVTGPLIVELEPSSLPATSELAAFDHRLRASVVRLQGGRDVAALTSLAADQVRQITGFDRVMVYRFDADWNGEVVAEAKRDDLEPFLGLHYPASDIPAQARRLYTLNLLRFIADVDYRPSPLVPRADPATGAPLDLGHAVLRSVSPIHIEYLKNMGVSASMSVSLVVDGVLSGLIACHHYSGPWRVPYRVRDTVEFLGHALAWQLRVLEAAAATAREQTVRSHEAELVRAVATTPNFEDAIATPALLALVEADGAALVLEDSTRTVGDVPDSAALRALVAELKRLERDIVTTDGPSDDLPSLPADFPGVLAVTISRKLDEYILWFRRPTEMTVDWAGDPRKVVVAQDGAAPPRLSPRGSFALWRETVRGRSLPWHIWHVTAASNLRRALLGGVRLRASEMRALNERLLDADRAKDDFIAVVSHELRTPLNAILGYGQLMGTGDVPREQLRKGLEVIDRNARALAELVDDLLDVSRMVSGKLALDLDGVELVSLVESVVESFAIAANAKQLRIKCMLDSSATPVLGDATRLRQVVANLISNAVKFTPKGGSITVTLTRLESDVELTIHDNGQGIPPDLLPLIFDMFRQGDSGFSRRSRGLGIGLALARRITELHGGRITADSQGTGRGATFRVRIPMAPVRPSRVIAAVGPASSALSNVRALVVDDDDDARELVSMVLARDGAQVTTASSAADALDALARGAFDILVSDVGMPDMDGLQLVRELRARGGRTPAVALTAYSRAHDRTTALQAGFDAHVPKPVDAHELVAVVASVCGRVARERG